MRRFSYYLIALLLALQLQIHPSFSQTVVNEKSGSVKEKVAEASAHNNATPKQKEALEEFLNKPLAGIKPSAVMREMALTDEGLSDREIYAEYGVKKVIEQQYSHFNIRLCWTTYPVGAYGLYTYYRDPMATNTDFGTEGDLDVVEGVIRFWQGPRFIEVLDKAKGPRRDSDLMIKLATAISSQLNEFDSKRQAVEDINSAKALPSVVRNLPAGSLNLRTARYILGPKSLAHLLHRDIGQYEFYPDFGTEIALADYEQGNGQTSLLIIEYHTPQQSISAFSRLMKYRESLSPDLQAKMLIRREGNYLVEADNFSDNVFAQNIANSVKYNYVVKWLDNNTGLEIADRKRISQEASKTATLLISVFGLIGLTLITALILGTAFGVFIFYLRRRNPQYVEAFTDAGGMMRLNLDSIGSLALPPAKEEDEKEESSKR